MTKSASFIDHLVFRVSDLVKTDQFYTALLCEPERDEESLMYTVGATRLFFTLPFSAPTQRFNKEEVGLNHLAFGMRTLEELQRLENKLNSLGFSHSGIKVDQYGLKEFIWLDDPDGMRIEFYLRPDSTSHT